MYLACYVELVLIGHMASIGWRNNGDPFISEKVSVHSRPFFPRGYSCRRRTGRRKCILNPLRFNLWHSNLIKADLTLKLP